MSQARVALGLREQRAGNEWDDVVIGSGPVGFAAALGVTARGGRPAIIDFGASPTFATPRLQRTSTVALKGEGERARVFDYPSSMVASSDGSQLPVSSARGGLSNIWGAGILLRSRDELHDLDPVFEGIQRGYLALLDVIPAAGADDRTSNRFPWPKASHLAPQSARYSRMVAALQSSKNDVLIGYPRVAVNSAHGRCTRCGQCLHGCPLDLFFNARHALTGLQAAGMCSLQSGPVLSLTQERTHVELQLPGKLIRAKRVFLAAGPIGSPSLLQRSGLAPARLAVQDSAVFYAAFVNSAAADGTEADYTSSHAVAYSSQPGEEDFQLAFYESNPEYSDRLAALVPALGRFIRMPSRVAAHINAAIGFLDSSVSGTLLMEHANGRTWVTRQPAPMLRRHALDVVERTAASTREFGLRPIPGLVLVPPTGSGYHAGASLPMGGDMMGLDGRLKSAESVFVVDATVLPNIAAGSHTFTAMANAHRIAVEAL